MNLFHSTRTTSCLGAIQLLAFAIVAFAILALAPIALASEVSSDSSVKAMYLDLSIPDSPAFAVAGMSPSDVIHPGTLREFGVALLSGIGSDGKFRQGVAVDVAPYLAWAGRNLTLETYRSPRAWVRRVAARTQLSIGSEVEQEASLSGRTIVGVGVRSVLLDRGDPRLDAELSDEFRRILEFREAPEGPPSDVGVPREILNLSDSLDEARGRATARLWNRAKIELGAAWRLEAADGRTKSLQGNGGSVWANGAVGLSHWGQVIIHGKFDSTARRDSTGDNWVGAVIPRVGTDSWTIMAETSLTHQRTRMPKKRDSWGRIVLGSEVRLADGTWLVVALGSEIGRGAGASGFVTSAKLKWALSAKRGLR